MIWEDRATGMLFATGYAVNKMLVKSLKIPKAEGHTVIRINKSELRQFIIEMLAEKLLEGNPEESE